MMKILGKTESRNCTVCRYTYSDEEGFKEILVCGKKGFAIAAFENIIPYNDFNDRMDWLEMTWVHAKLIEKPEDTFYMIDSDEAAEFSYSETASKKDRKKAKKILVDFLQFVESD